MPQDPINPTDRRDHDYGKLNNELYDRMRLQTEVMLRIPGDRQERGAHLLDNIDNPRLFGVLDVPRWMRSITDPVGQAAAREAVEDVFRSHGLPVP